EERLFERCLLSKFSRFLQFLLTLLEIVNIHNQSIRLIEIAMTAHDSSITNELKTAGFDDCLFKPFHTEALQAVIGINGNTSEKPSDKKKQHSHSRTIPTTHSLCR
ncbi:MAG: hypothetical protein PUH64_01290, partial [Prevotella sp.]|nr:hypothetical protein [Prevotella sp.]